VANENGRSLAGVISELKNELKEFIRTRISMFVSEMRDKVAALKVAAPLIIGGLVLAGTAWFILTAALIQIIAVAFYPSQYAVFFSLIIVGVAYLLAGVVMVSFAIRELKDRGIMPVRTMKVLKEDQVWLQTEAKQQI
jgi:uncharacterized membrane protein YqjE